MTPALTSYQKWDYDLSVPFESYSGQFLVQMHETAFTTHSVFIKYIYVPLATALALPVLAFADFASAFHFSEFMEEVFEAGVWVYLVTAHIAFELFLLSPGHVAAIVAGTFICHLFIHIAAFESDHLHYIMAAVALPWKLIAYWFGEHHPLFAVHNEYNYGGHMILGLMKLPLAPEFIRNCAPLTQYEVTYLTLENQCLYKIGYEKNDLAWFREHAARYANPMRARPVLEIPEFLDWAIQRDDLETFTQFCRILPDQAGHFLSYYSDQRNVLSIAQRPFFQAAIAAGQSYSWLSNALKNNRLDLIDEACAIYPNYLKDSIESFHYGSAIIDYIANQYGSNFYTTAGYTPLMLAARSRNENAVRYWLDRGADPKVRHRDMNKTAAQIARDHFHYGIENLLNSLGGGYIPEDDGKVVASASTSLDSLIEKCEALNPRNRELQAILARLKKAISQKNLWAVFEVTTRPGLQNAFRKLATLVHPDKHPEESAAAAAIFAAISGAKDQLLS